MPDILNFIIALCRHEPGAAWLRAEMNRRLIDIREETALAGRIIPACVGELTDENVDDIVTGCWFMTVHVEIDMQILLELDALGAALDLIGCVTRFDLHVQDALLARRQRDPLEDPDTETRH